MTGKNATETRLADAAGIRHAAAILERGGLVAVPTETVFGLAARADSAAAVAKIYEAKGRPSFNPLIVHVRDFQQAARYGEMDEAARFLIERVWPGPLTLVVPRKPDAKLAPAVTAGLPTVALRAPRHPTMRALLQECEFPLAAPSANRSGFVSPTNVAHVLATLDGRIDLVLDDGHACDEGLESTIVALRENGDWDELRPGPVDLDALLREYTKHPHTLTQGSAKVEAPGQMAQHYAPGKPVRLNAETANADEFHIGFGSIGGDLSLSQEGNLQAAARQLYDCLHEAAKTDLPRIAIAPIPDEGIGKAINDRLRRAAA